MNYYCSEIAEWSLLYDLSLKRRLTQAEYVRSSVLFYLIWMMQFEGKTIEFMIQRAKEAYIWML